MKNVLRIILSMTLLISSVGYAQTYYKTEEEQKSKKELKAERRAEREAKAKAFRKEVRLVLEQRDFALKTDMITTKWGRTIPVMNTLNFVIIQDDNVVVQFGNPMKIGMNGVGGITFQGKIQRYEFNEYKKDKGFNLRVEFNSPNTTYLANLFIDVVGERIRARFTDGPERLTMAGQYERASESNLLVNSNIRLPNN